MYWMLSVAKMENLLKCHFGHNFHKYVFLLLEDFLASDSLQQRILEYFAYKVYFSNYVK